MFKIWKLIYDSRCPELSHKKLFWVPKDQIELDMENTVKLEVERQWFTKIVLHHECFCKMLCKFFVQHCELSVRDCPYPGRDEFEINLSVYYCRSPVKVKVINLLRTKWIFSKRQGLIYTSSYWFACYQNIFMTVTKYIFTLPSCASSAANDVYKRPHKVTCCKFLVVRCIFLWLLSYFWVTFSKNSLVVGVFLLGC